MWSRNTLAYRACAGFTSSYELSRNAEMQAIADEFGIMAWEYCWNNPQATSLAEKGFALRTADAVARV